MNRILIITGILILSMTVAAFAVDLDSTTTDVEVTTDAYATIESEGNTTANVAAADYIAGVKDWTVVDGIHVISNANFTISATFSQLTNSTCVFKVSVDGGTPQASGNVVYTGPGATNGTDLDQGFHITSLTPVSLDDDTTHTTTVTYTISQ